MLLCWKRSLPPASAVFKNLLQITIIKFHQIRKFLNPTEIKYIKYTQ